MKSRRKSCKLKIIQQKIQQFDYKSPQLSMAHANSMPSTCQTTKVMENLPYKKSTNENIRHYLVEYKNKQNHYKEYKKLNYKGTIYELGNNVLIKNNEPGSTDFIGKITMIILIISYSQEIIPILQLQWLELEELTEAMQFDFISENEVFETQHIDFTFVDCLNGKCEILSLEEYDQQRNINPQQTFFTRAKYDIKKQKIIDPPVSKWPKHCICCKPLNPDIIYVCCESCQQWYHASCVNIKQETLDEVDFVCMNCQRPLMENYFQ